MGEPKAIVDEALLKRFVPINALADNSLRQIAKKAVLAEYKPGDYLFKKNQRDGNTLYLLSGDIDLVAGGQSVHVEAGSETARHPIGQHQPRQVDAVARSAVTCIQVETNLVDMVLTWQQSAVEVGEIEQDKSGDWMTRMLQNRLFLKLPPANIQKIMMLMEDMEVSEGDTIIRQGEEGDYYYYIREGRCQVLRQPRPGAAEVKLAELPAGESFGEEALVSEEKRNATVRMLTDGLLMRLAKKDFVKLISDPLHNIVDYYKSEVLVSDGAAWVDVRLPDEFANSHISDAINIPLPTLRLQLKQLDKRRAYVLYCDTGRRSSTAAFLMNEHGFDAYVLGGGLMSLPPEVFLVSDHKEDANRAGVEMISSQIVKQSARDAEAKRTAASKEESKKTEARKAESKKAEARKAEPKKEPAAKDAARKPEPKKSSAAPAKPVAETKSEPSRSTTTTQDVLARAREALEQARRVKGKEPSAPKPASPAAPSKPTAAAGPTAEEQQRAVKALQEAEAAQMLLQQELQRTEDELSRVNHQLEEMLQENQRLEVALAKQETSGKGTAEELQKRIESERARNRADLEELNQKVRVLETERNTARRENEEQRGAMDKLRQELNEQIAGWEKKFGEEASRHQRERDALEKQLQELRQARDQAEAQAQSGQRATDEMAEKLRQERNTLESQLQDAKVRHDSELATLNERLAQAERAVEESQTSGSALQELEQQVESLQAALTEQSAELATLDGQLAEAREQQQSTDAARVQLEAQIKQLAAELETSRAASGQLEQVRAELDELRARADESGQALQVAMEEKNRAEERAEQATADQQRTQEELDFTQRTVTKALMDKEAAETKLAKAEEQLEHERSEHERRESEVGGELDELRRDTAALREALEQASAERDAAEQARQAAETAAAEARNERKARDRELKAELDRLQQEIAQYQQHLEAAQTVREEAEQARREAEERANKVISTNDKRQQELEGQIQEYQTVLARMEEELDQVGRITEEADSTRKTHEDRIQRMAQEMERLRRLVKDAEHEKEDAWQVRKQAEQEVARARREAVDAIQRANDQMRNAQNDLQRVRTETEHEIKRRLELETNRFAAKDVAPAPQPVVSRPNFQDATSRSEREVTLGAERIRDTKTVTGRHQPQQKKSSAGLVLFLVLLTVAGVTAFVFKDQILSILGVGSVAEPPAASDTAAASPANEPPAEAPPVTAAAPVQSSPTAKPQVKPIPVQSPPPARRSTETSRRDTVQDPLRGGGRAPVMVRIPAGEFLMGDDTTSDTTVRPQHAVSVRAFAIGQTEVTFEAYELFAQATGREVPDDQGRGRGQHPVVNVSWNDARAYAAWLSEQTGRRYRLPTESEWEYAARAGQKGAYWWGSAIGNGNANCFNCGSRWDGLQPAPVASFRANPMGIHDTAGNVAEWTRDCYHASYDGAPSDGSAWETGECTERVVRGGSFASSSKAVRTVNRERFTLDSRLDNLGFRLVREE